MIVEGVAGKITEPCNFIFDTQQGFGEAFAIQWLRFKASAQEAGYGRLVGVEPLFRDDKQLRQLQAADLYAWHVRKNLESGHDLAGFPAGRLRNISSLRAINFQWHTADVEDARSELLSIMKQVGMLDPDAKLQGPDKKLRKKATQKQKHLKASSGQVGASE
jgi:hypothetical protein